MSSASVHTSNPILALTYNLVSENVDAVYIYGYLQTFHNVEYR